MQQPTSEGMKLIAEFTAELIAAVTRRSEPPPPLTYFEMIARDRGIELNSRPNANRERGPVPSR